MPSFEQPHTPQPEKFDSLLMSAEAYAESKHEIPYVYELNKGDRSLHYFGARHSMNPDDTMFADLRAQMDAYKPDLVIVEGTTAARNRKDEVGSWLQSHDVRQAILTAGETGAALKWAQDHKVDYDCPEPTQAEEIIHLEAKGFSRDDIFLYYMTRLAEQYYRVPVDERKQTLEAYMNPYIEQFGVSAAWPEYQFTFSNLQNLFNRTFKVDLSLSNPDFLKDVTDPIPWPEKVGRQAVTNNVAKESTRFRDQRIVGEIVKSTQKYKRVFVVYGASHAVMQEPAMREALTPSDVFILPLNLKDT